MAELASSCGIIPRTIIVGASTLARGVRVIKDSAGVCAVAGATVRGDFTTLIPGLTGEAISAVSMGTGGKVPALAGEASCDAGDAAYAFASGAYGVTSGGGAVLVGKWASTTASGKLGEVELETVA